MKIELGGRCVKKFQMVFEQMSPLITLRSLKRVHARSLIFRILALTTRQISTVRSLDDKNL